MTLEKFFNCSADILAIIDVEGKIKNLNRAFELLTGYTVSKGMAHLITDFMFPSDVGNVLLALQAVGKGKVWRDQRFRIRCSNGSSQWVSWSGAIDRGSGNIYLIGRPIDPPSPIAGSYVRKQHEQLQTIAQELNLITEQLEEQKQNYQLLMRQLLDFRVNSLAASWMLDLHNMHLSFSPEFYSKFGFSNLRNHPAEFLLDEWVSQYVVLEDRTRLNEALFNSLQSGNESDESKLIEFEIMNPQGVLIPVQMSLMVINDELGRAKTLFGGIYNLSEQKALKNLQLLLSQERKLNEEKLALQEKELIQKSTELSDLQGLNTKLRLLCAELEAKLANFKATNTQLMQANEVLTAEIAQLKQKYSASAAVESKTSEQATVIRSKNKKTKVQQSEEKTAALVIASPVEKVKSIEKSKSRKTKMLSSNLGDN